MQSYVVAVDNVEELCVYDPNTKMRLSLAPLANHHDWWAVDNMITWDGRVVTVTRNGSDYFLCAFNPISRAWERVYLFPRGLGFLSLVSIGRDLFDVAKHIDKLVMHRGT